MNNDMYFDTDTFDFDSLTDIKGFDSEAEANAHNIKPLTRETRDIKHMGGVVDDISDLGLNVPDTLYDEDYDEDYDDASDLTNEPTEEESINSFSDDTVYSLEDGSQVTGKELKELTRVRDAVKSQNEWFDGAQQAYKDESEAIAYQLQYQKSAVDMNIEWLQSQMQKATNNTERGELYQQLREAEATKREVSQKTDAIMKAQAQREDMLLNVRHQKADQALDKMFGGEYSKNKQAFTGYAVNDLGIPASELDRLYGTGIMTAILESWKFREMNKRAKNQEAAFIQKTKQNPKSVQSANKVQQEKLTKVKAQKALANMGSSRKANVDAFAFLKD